AGSRYPRPEGTGKAVIEATRPWEGVLSAAIAAAATVVLVPHSTTLLPLTLFMPAFLVVMLLRWLCHRRLGGVTGDCLGAAIEIAEATFLLAAVLWGRN